VQSPELNVCQSDVGHTPQVDPPQAPALQSNVPQANAAPAKPNESGIVTNPPHPTLLATEVPDDPMSVSDSLSYTSTLPDIFDVGSDDSAPPATGPWMTIDHFTGEVTVDDDQSIPPVPTAPSCPSPAGVEIAIAPRSGMAYITETKPALLFGDEDVRPQWLMTAVKTFLRFVPYFGGLGKVVDLYLAQEARLGYPKLVCTFFFSFVTYVLTTLSPLVSRFHLEIGPPRSPHS